MFGTTSALYRNTPTIMAVDNRGLAVLTIAYHREQVGASVSSRIQHQVFNLQGQLIEQWDPRFFELSRTQQRVLPNQATRYSLSGLVLQSNNVDAGWQIAFHDAAGLLAIPGTVGIHTDAITMTRTCAPPGSLNKPLRAAKSSAWTTSPMPGLAIWTSATIAAVTWSATMTRQAV